MQFVEEMRFAHAHIFPFSAREGTAAANFADAVPSALKKERLHQLQALVARTGQTEKLRFIGTQRPVLWEGEGRPLTDQSGQLWSGLTDNYLRVMAVAPADVDLHNRITLVDLEAVNGDFLSGVTEYT
jgi:tRNA A37 methylthiotransferase MiaB